jgi:two-component system, OmpR family, sensor histidine kinase KdpD
MRVYLGAAPSVGKTVAMLGEAHRRASAGVDVVVGVVDTHAQQHLAARLEGLEVVSRRQSTEDAVQRIELDVDAVLGRRPAVVVIDGLAGVNAPGATHAYRWQEVEEILDAGIDVLSAVDIGQLASLADVVEEITGIAAQERVPDAVVRRAEQVELVDMTAEALRRRPAHGTVSPADCGGALGTSFSVGTLIALRELALGWLSVQDVERRRRSVAQDVPSLWEAGERVVVGLPGGPVGEAMIRRAARVAQRSGGALLAVHVLSGEDVVDTAPGALRQQRALVESLGGTYHQVLGDDVGEALLEFAHSVDATQLVLGTSRRSRWARMLRDGIGARVIDGSGEIDVHIVTVSSVAPTGWRLPPFTGALTARRRWLGWALAGIGVPLATIGCLAAQSALSLASVLLVFLLLVMAVAIVGGLWPAVTAAVAGGLAANWFFTEPTGQLHVNRLDDVVALAGGLIVAVAVATVVDRSARRATAAARSRAETAMLASLARSVLAGDRGLPGLLEEIREAFGLRAVSMVEQAAGEQRTVGTSGVPDGDAAEQVGVTDTLTLRLWGRTLPAGDRRVLVAFAEQAAVALQQGRLAEQAAEADRLAAGNSMRNALLAAVSHDLRTPLAGIKAAATALRADGLVLSGEDRAELMATIDESADRLGALVDNLLDMSRLQAGVVTPALTPCDLPAVVDRAQSWVDVTDRPRLVEEWPDGVPPVLADPGLLERVAANLLANAARHAPHGPLRVTAAAVGARVELRVVDRGPGVPESDRERLFAPFQRLGDRPGGQGLGLGLAVARGLTEAMGGALTAEDTPGGGLTMVVSLPAARITPAVPSPLAAIGS